MNNHLEYYIEYENGKYILKETDTNKILKVIKEEDIKNYSNFDQIMFKSAKKRGKTVSIMCKGLLDN